MNRALASAEDAVRLIRLAGWPALALHATGSVPFALGVLAFWTASSTPRLPASQCAWFAALLTFLLVWMSAWRAVYALRLRDTLFGTTGSGLSTTLRRSLFSQAALAGWKLTLLPLAVLAVVPAARAIAFFRMAPAWADRPMAEMLSTARQHSRHDPWANWWGLTLLGGFSLFVFLNVAITIGGLPHLVKALTGYESAFTRMGTGLIAQPLFWLVAVLSTWMLIDPLLQAFYCVRSFQAHSVVSGADLIARLRDLQRPLAAALLLLAVALPVHLRAEVSADELERAVNQTLRSSDYDWRLPTSAEPAAEESTFVRFSERMIGRVQKAWEQFWQWVGGIFRRPGSMPAMSAPPSAASRPLYLLIGVIVLAAAAFLVWRLLSRRTPDSAVIGSIPSAAVDLNDQALTADRLPEEEWLSLADGLVQSGDFRAALRALYLGNLAWLHSRQLISIHSGKTNFEYQREFSRRGRPSPSASGLLAGNINAFERVWYGMHAAGLDDVDRFRGRFREMKELFA